MMSTLSSHNGKEVIRVHTLCQRTLSFPTAAVHCVADLKAEICRARDLLPEEVQVVCSGRECVDEEAVSPESFVLIRSTASRCVDVTVKVTGDKNKREISLSIPLNTRVGQIKSLLFKDKHTKWSTTGQRLIASSKVMKDHHMLGDYILHAASRKSQVKSSSSLNIYLSQTIDSRAEMEIHVIFSNKKEVKFHFEFGLPLYYAKDILDKQFAIPKTSNYHFVPEDGRPALTDMNKCLLDYGILPSNGKKLRLTLALAVKTPVPTPVIICPIPAVSNAAANGCTTHKTQTHHAPASLTHFKSLDSNSSGTGSTPPLLISSSSGLKKRPDRKRKSPACSMFGGMKKGFLSSDQVQRKK